MKETFLEMSFTQSLHGMEDENGRAQICASNSTQYVCIGMEFAGELSYTIFERVYCVCVWCVYKKYNKQ